LLGIRFKFAEVAGKMFSLQIDGTTTATTTFHATKQLFSAFMSLLLLMLLFAYHFSSHFRCLLLPLLVSPRRCCVSILGVFNFTSSTSPLPPLSFPSLSLT